MSDLGYSQIKRRQEMKRAIWIITIFGLAVLALTITRFIEVLAAPKTQLIGPAIYLPIVFNQGAPTPTPTPTPTDTPVPGFGAATGRTLWNDQPFAGVTVKLCTTWSMLGGCQTQVYSAVSGTDGRYTITEIPAGVYDVAFKVPGQVEYSYIGGLHATVFAGQTVTIRDENIVKDDLKLISPINHATVTTTTPTLMWEAYPSAAYYEVYVVRNFAPYGTVVSFVKVTTLQYTFATPLAAGEYYWSIDAHNAAGKEIADNGYYYFVVAP
jgi:hypothetical protein